MRPFKLTPAFKQTVWGGDKLKALFQKNTECDSIGESWEVSAREEYSSKTASGESFRDYYSVHKDEILGKNAPAEFPVLVKLIDANDTLSVQVHPSGENGKTEMWYILHAEPDAKLVLGLNKPLTKKQLLEATANASLESHLHYQPVQAGDAYYIPAGLIHAIGKGIVILEVQQSSDTTYRLYDYGRPRMLHIDDAAKWANLSAYSHEPAPSGDCIVNCEFFKVFKCNLPCKLSGFAIVFAKDGQVFVDDLLLEKGEFAIIPASEADEASIVGEGEILYVKL